MGRSFHAFSGYMENTYGALNMSEDIAKHQIEASRQLYHPLSPSKGNQHSAWHWGPNTFWLSGVPQHGPSYETSLTVQIWPETEVKARVSATWSEIEFESEATNIGPVNEAAKSE